MADIKNIGDSPGAQNTLQEFNYSGKVDETDRHVLQLSGLLQRTLEPDKILELFDDEAASIVTHDGLAYRTVAGEYSCLYGDEAIHRCNYRLVLLGQDIGELSFFRKRPFTEAELDKLETLIAGLIYPLRNSLLYKSALEKALRDPLTGVSNRAALDIALAQEVDLAQRHDTPFSLVVLDIDKFKDINDSYGHLTGDAIIRRVAERMAESARRSDIIYRYGGEEFVVLLRNTEEKGALFLAERIRRNIEGAIFNYDELAIRVTISAGVAQLRSDDKAHTLLQRGDKALYEAKAQGRNHVVYL